MDDQAQLGLLLADDQGAPALADAVATDSAARQSSRGRPPLDSWQRARPGTDINSLEAQGWAVVVADTANGRRALDLIAPLVEKRARDQRASVLTVAVPPAMDMAQAIRWRREDYPQLLRQEERTRPRYLLILEDHDQVSLATQRVLSADGFPGRLVCPDERGYQAYVDKVLRWERNPSQHERARSLFYTVHDRTTATQTGYRQLAKRLYDRCRRKWQDDPYLFPASSVENHGKGRPADRAWPDDPGDPGEPDPQDFLTLTGREVPTLLFSLSHGLGPPGPGRTGWTPGDARRRQGAMSFGRAGAIHASDVADAPFLPGGLWFYFAGFGAGTPVQSAYRDWLQHLVDAGLDGAAHVSRVLNGLAHDGGFTSALAQAALANPRGPLGLIGQVDLSWSYGYQPSWLAESHDGQPSGRSRDYERLLTNLMDRQRLGSAMRQLQKLLDVVDRDISERASHWPAADETLARVATGHQWMRQQDLASHVLLGDPAVRLPLAPELTRALDDWSAAELLVPLSGSPGRAPSRRTSLAADERAILEYLLGRLQVSELATVLDMDEDSADERARAYREGGRQALSRFED